MADPRRGPLDDVLRVRGDDDRLIPIVGPRSAADGGDHGAQLGAVGGLSRPVPKGSRLLETARAGAHLGLRTELERPSRLGPGLVVVGASPGGQEDDAHRVVAVGQPLHVMDLEAGAGGENVLRGNKAAAADEVLDVHRQRGNAELGGQNSPCSESLLWLFEAKHGEKLVGLQTRHDVEQAVSRVRMKEAS